MFAHCDGFEEGQGGPESRDGAVFHGPVGVFGEGAFDVVLRAAFGGVGEDGVADAGAEVEEGC